MNKSAFLILALISPPARAQDFTLTPAAIRGPSTSVQADAKPPFASVFIWNWGDGQTSQTNTPHAAHVYSGPGAYDVSLTVNGVTIHHSFQPRAATIDSYWQPKHPGFGFIVFRTPLEHPFTSLTTTLTVPAPPPGPGVLFIWPGLAPLGPGVLQPVLTWGHSCAPTPQPPSHSSWWISGQYVRKGLGCRSGPAMRVNVGDSLRIAMVLNGTLWHQQIADAQTGQTVSFDYDLMGTPQNRAYIQFETFHLYPQVPVVFSNTTLTWTGAAPDRCFPHIIGPYDSMSFPRPSPDGQSCHIDTITLRAPGIP